MVLMVPINHLDLELDISTTTTSHMQVFATTINDYLLTYYQQH